MVQGARNKPKTKEVQFVYPWDTATLLAFLKYSMANPKIEMDELEKPLVYPSFLFDIQSNPMKAFGSTNPFPMRIADALVGSRLAIVNNGDDLVYGQMVGLSTLSAMYYWNATSSAFEKVRTPVIWKSALISANGSTAIWTSGVGKKARLMGIRMTLVNGTTAAAACLLKVLDVAADTGIGVQICGAALGAVGTSSIIVNENYGNGYLMAATNTAININLSSALAVAGVFVQVWGTEE
jgi:hypothetical protein